MAEAATLQDRIERAKKSVRMAEELEALQDKLERSERLCCWLGWMFRIAALAWLVSTLLLAYRMGWLTA